MRSAEILAALAARAPFERAAEWDPVGLTLGDPRAPARRIGVCHEVTEAVVAELERAPVDLLVTYHPLLFRATTRLVAGPTPEGRALRLIRAGTALAVAHTNFDVAEGGAADALAEALGLGEVERLRAALRGARAQARHVRPGRRRRPAAREPRGRRRGQDRQLQPLLVPERGHRHVPGRRGQRPGRRRARPARARARGPARAAGAARARGRGRRGAAARPPVRGAGVRPLRPTRRGARRRPDRPARAARSRWASWPSAWPRRSAAPRPEWPASSSARSTGSRSCPARARTSPAPPARPGPTCWSRATCATTRFAPPSTRGLALIDAGHAATERPGVEQLLALVAAQGVETRSLLDLDPDPWRTNAGGET